VKSFSTSPHRIQVAIFGGLLIAAVSLLAVHVSFALTPVKIRDIMNRPRDFEGKDITVNGTVTNAVSLILVKYYELQDDTGSIRVITDKLLPGRGEKLKVIGRMAVVEIGTERWVVLREIGDSGQPAGPAYPDPDSSSHLNY
jgi:hypothetical protein